MSRFESLMDDMKIALILSFNKKKVFLPGLLSIVITVIFTIITYILFVFLSIAIIVPIVNSSENFSNSLIFVFLAVLVISLLFIIVYLSFEIAIVSWIVGAVNNEELTFKLITNNIRSYFLPTLGNHSLLFVIGLLATSILAIPIILYLVLSALISGSLGFILLITFIQVYIGYWLLIMVNDSCSGLESIKKNISFGKKYLKLMIFIFILQYLIQTNLPAQFSLLGIVLVPIVLTYMRIVILLTYRRYKSVN